MSKKELTLISGGRVSKKDFVLGAKYEDASGKPISFPFARKPKTETGTFQPSNKYYKVRRASKGEKIFRTRMKKAYSLNAVIEGSREGRDYEITHTIYLYTDVDDEKEGERLLKKVWNEKTNFVTYEEFTVEDDVEFSKIGEDQFAIKTRYLEAKSIPKSEKKKDEMARKYSDDYKTKVTQTRLILTNVKKEFSENWGTKGSDVKKIGGKKFGWLKLDK